MAGPVKIEILLLPKNHKISFKKSVNLFGDKKKNVNLY